MLSGQIFNALDAGLRSKLASTRQKLWRFNSLPPEEASSRQGQEMLLGLLGCLGEGFIINQPFRCDYGENICIGRNFFANFNLTILDETLVTIGDNVFLGPNVSIYTACHPTDPQLRNTGVEWAKPVTIGNDVWIGGNVTICPGVTIGRGTTVGAGSVVTRDLPSNVVAAGNPCRVVRYLDHEAHEGCSARDGNHEQLGLDSCAG